MTIETVRLTHSSMMLVLSGRLDTSTAPLLERKLKQGGAAITELVLNFSGVTYISSMGLRLLLQTQKEMTEKGRKCRITSLAPEVKEVFEMTGFINLMVQEERFVVIRKDGPGVVKLSLIGEMTGENLPPLEEELSKLREERGGAQAEIEVILDLEQLIGISASACHEMEEIISRTAWEKRRLEMINASPEVYYTFKSEGLDRIVTPKDSARFA